MKHTTVLQVIESAVQGGAQRAMEILCQELPRRGFRVVAVLPDDGPLFSRLRQRGVETYPLPIDRRIDIRAGQTVAELVRRLGIDIVHVHTPKAGFLVRRPARRAGAKVVMNVHGLGMRGFLEYLDLSPWEKLKKSFLCGLEMLSERATDHFILETELDMRRGIYPPEKTTLVYNGVDPTQWPYSPPPGNRTILYPARLSLQKDPATLLRAAGLLRDQGRPVRILFAGDGEIRGAMEKMARQMDLGSYVEFLEGRLSGPLLYAAAALVVLTSRWEGQPFAVLEAMASGRPVIATRCGALPETLGSAGVLVEREDYVTVAAEIDRLLNDHSERNRLAAAARRRLEENFTVERMVNSVAELYRRLLGKNS